MKWIIDGKLYNTETAKEVCRYNKIGHPQLCYSESGIPWDYILYVTKNGQYFEFYKRKKEIKLVDNSFVKALLAKIDTDLYAKLFGKVEEG